MAEHRRKYSPPFKSEVILLLLQAGCPVTQIAKELEIDNGTLSNLVNTWKLNTLAINGPNTSGVCWA